MPEDAPDPYDVIPYAGHPKSRCHPDAIAVAGWLAGLEPAPLESARVLELGCADGANLLPIAFRAPEREVVGIERSALQAGMFQTARDVLGVKNLEVVHADMRHLERDLGRFDYIIAEGVYSWVPADARDALLALCAAHLSERGLAVISYNTYPVWALRAELRRALLARAPLDLPPRERVRRARAALELLTELTPAQPPRYAALLAEEIAIAKSTPDNFLLHDLIAPDNVPLHLASFLEAAEASGLSYVADLAEERDPIHAHGLRAALSERASSPAEAACFGDLLAHRGLRCTVLARTPERAARAAAATLAAVQLRARLEVAEGPDAARLDDGAPLRLRSASGAVIEQRRALHKAALLALADAWPDTLSWEALLARASGGLHEAGGWPPGRVPDEGEREALAADLLVLQRWGVVHLRMSALTDQLDGLSRPSLDALTRFEAERHAWVTSADHRVVPLDPFDRALVRLLDGARPPSAVMAALYEMVRSGTLAIQTDRGRLSDPRLLAEVLPRILEQKVAALALEGLLR